MLEEKFNPEDEFGPKDFTEEGRDEIYAPFFMQGEVLLFSDSKQEIKEKSDMIKSYLDDYEIQRAEYIKTKYSLFWN